MSWLVSSRCPCLVSASVAFPLLFSSPGVEHSGLLPGRISLLFCQSDCFSALFLKITFSIPHPFPCFMPTWEWNYWSSSPSTWRWSFLTPCAAPALDVGWTWADVGLVLGWHWVDVGLMLGWCWVGAGLTLGRCWVDVGLTLGWHWVDVGLTLGWLSLFTGWEAGPS